MPGGRPHVDRRMETLRAIRAYQMSNGWAPSQREIGEMLGVGLNTANLVIKELEREGKIKVGPYPRQIHIVGTTFNYPVLQV